MLFTPVQLGRLKLGHRVVMAPLTRMRSEGTVPGRLAVDYYGQRASYGGLIVSEATQIHPTGQGYPDTPGCTPTSRSRAGPPSPTPYTPKVA
jgi:N-ethylmaleimide reductase